MAKFLDSNGLSHLWEKIKTWSTEKFVGKEPGKGLSTNDYTTAEKEKLAGLEKITVDEALSGSSANPVQNKAVHAAMGKKLDASLKGAANGVASLDETGKVPAAQLPSYVDDVVEGYASGGKFYEDSGHSQEIACESGKIYVDKETMRELYEGLGRLSEREQAYLLYRYGFTDDVEHTMIGSAIHFNLRESRAKTLEDTAMDNLWLELPWWF